MANAAQLVNCLHSCFLAEGESCICTPTYHVFDLFKGHQGATAIRTVVPDAQQQDGLPLLSVSASHRGDCVTITVANLSAEHDTLFSLESIGASLQNSAACALLTHEDLHACNTFDAPNRVCPITYTADVRSTFSLQKGSILAITAKRR